MPAPQSSSSDIPPPAPSPRHKAAHPRRPLSPSCLRGEHLLFRPASTDYRKTLTSPIPMPIHVPASPHPLLVTSSWPSSHLLPPRVARRLAVAPRRASSSARNVPFLPRPGRKLSESVSRSISLQNRNSPIQAVRLPAPGPTHLLLPFPHPSPNALQDLPSFFLWTLSLIQVYAPLPTTILLMTTMTTNHGENRSLMQNADELGNTPSVSLSEHSLPCMCVCCYLSTLYILQRNAPACLHVTLVHPLKEEEAAAESYFLLGISLSIYRFSFLPLSLRNFLSSFFFSRALLLVHVYNPFVFSVTGEHWTLIFFVCDRM